LLYRVLGVVEEMDKWEGVDADELKAEQSAEKEAEEAAGGKVEAKEEFILTLDDMDDIMEQGDTMDGLEGEGAAMQMDFDDEDMDFGDDGDMYGDFEL
jgi:hypothetical protein